MPTATELTQACLARISERDPALHAFIRVMPQEALAAAQASDRRRAAGTLLGPLDGMPVAIKDNIDMAGVPTSGGIGHYRDVVATSDAPIVARLKAAGAVLIGKTNLHEAALGATNDNPWFGRCDNPLRSGYTPGGSSGGSAAAVAASMCTLALGTDTMGSVRIPAAYCGIVGFKPSRGVISLDGVMPLSPSLDTVGILASSVRHVLEVWPALVGAPSSDGQPGDMQASTPGTGRIAVASDFPDAQSPPFAALMRSATACARALDLGVTEPSLAGLALTTIRREGFVLIEIEAEAVHRVALAGNPEGFSAPLRSMLAYGARQPSERAAQLRVSLHAAALQVISLLTDVDALILPTTPQAAFAHGIPAPVTQPDYTGLANIAGLPAISIPWGYDADGMPLGLQLIGKAGADLALLQLALRFDTWRGRP